MQAADVSGLKSAALLPEARLKGYAGNLDTWGCVNARNNFCHGASRELSKFDSHRRAHDEKDYTFRHE
jgi:hypothetical protein